MKTYTYDILGNLFTKSDQGTYTYGGIQYANPHAVTRIATSTGTTTIGYDANGNATSTGRFNYTWNYRDRLTQTATGTATTTYGYDQVMQRVRQTVLGTATTTYPNKYYDRVYNATRATTTVYIWAGDTLIATVEGSGTATNTRYIHPDHLGSTNLVTNASGTVMQTLEYYPYGSERTNTSAGGVDSRRAFITQYQDDSSNLNYLNARYYNSSQGGVVSQDPTHLALGNPQAIKQITGQDQQMYLADPQQANSYSYGRNNPITNKDPQGNFAVAIPVYYAAVSAPVWVPAVGAGVLAAATYITADIAMRNNGMRQVPFDFNRLVRVPDVPQPLDLLPPNLPPSTPEWIKWTLIGGGVAGVAGEIYDKAKQINDLGKRWRQRVGSENSSDSAQGSGSVSTSIIAGPNSNVMSARSNALVISQRQSGGSGSSQLSSLFNRLASALSKLSTALSGSK